MDYGYPYNYWYTLPETSWSSVIWMFLGILGGVFLVALAIGIFLAIVNWKVFKKAGKPGWAAIVPFYNQYVLAEITWGNGWFFLIFLGAIIPIIGTIAVIVFTILTYIKLAKAFDKDGGFAVGLIFLNPIFMAILAFGNSKYTGVPENNMFSNYNNNFNSQNNDTTKTSVKNVSGTMVNGNDTISNQEPMENNTQVNNNANVRFCTYCGTKLENNALFCTNCGSQVR